MQIQSLAIILISYQRPMLLKKALESLISAIDNARNVNQQFSFQVYLCINGSDDVSYQLSLELQTRSVMHIEHNAKPLTPAAARNQLLQSVKSDFVFFMDDDVILPNDIFIHFRHFQNLYPKVDLWGGPNLTPPESLSQQKDCGWLVSQPFIVGPIAQRYVLSHRDISTGEQFNLMLCNLFVRSTLLQNGFEHFFKTAEENELIYRLQNKKCSMLSSPKLFVWHERRKTYTEFIKQIFYYGYGRGQLLNRVSLVKQKLFLLVPVLCICFLFLAFYFPQTIFSVVLSWLAFVQLMYLIEYRELNAKILILPLLMYAAYVFGLARGFIQMIFWNPKTKILSPEMNKH